MSPPLSREHPWEANSALACLGASLWAAAHGLPAKSSPATPAFKELTDSVLERMAANAVTEGVASFIFQKMLE